MTTNILKSTLLVLALAMGACGSSNDTTGKGGSGGSTGSAGSGGSTGMAGGGGAGTTGTAGGGGTTGMGGAGGGGTPSTIAQCGDLSTPKAVNDCIINLPTDSVGQTVTFTATADYNTCKM
jgi:hypothetical protein